MNLRNLDSLSLEFVIINEGFNVGTSIDEVACELARIFATARNKKRDRIRLGDRTIP